MIFHSSAGNRLQVIFFAFLSTDINFAFCSKVRVFPFWGYFSLLTSMHKSNRCFGFHPHRQRNHFSLQLCLSKMFYKHSRPLLRWPNFLFRINGLRDSAPTSITALNRSGQWQQNTIPRLSASTEGWGHNSGTYGGFAQPQQYPQPQWPQQQQQQAPSFSGFTANWAPPQ